ALGGSFATAKDQKIRLALNTLQDRVPNRALVDQGTLGHQAIAVKHRITCAPKDIRNLGFHRPVPVRKGKILVPRQLTANSFEIQKVFAVPGQKEPVAV